MRSSEALRLEQKAKAETMRLWRSSRHPGVIYFVKPVGRNIVKIGYSSKENWSFRLAALQNGSAERLQPLMLITGRPADEREHHERWADDRIRGEWFRYTREMQYWLRYMECEDFENAKLDGYMDLAVFDPFATKYEPEPLFEGGSNSLS
jgi:hypothetical protein